MADAHRPSASVRAVLRIVVRNRELRRVELAYAMFNIGEVSTWIALLVYAYARGGATESGVVATVMLIPSALLAPVLAAVGERLAPGRALAVGYAAQGLTSLFVAAAMLDHAQSIVTYLVASAYGVTYTLTRPTQAAFAPGLARRPEELAATNVVSGWIESATMLAAPALVGLVLAVGSPGAAFVVGAVAAAVGVVLVLPIADAVPAVETDDTAEGTVPAEGSLAFVRRDPHARTLVLLLGAQCVAIGALDVLYVELAQGVLHRGGDWAGYLNAAFGAGSLLAVGVTARLVGQSHLARPLVLSLAGWSVALFGLAAVPGVAGALALLALAGGSRATFDVTARTLLQRVARPDLLARVFGLLEGLEMAGLAAGSILVPALISLGGASAAFVAVGALLPLVALAAGRRLLDIDRHATVPVVEIALLRSMPLFALLPPPQLESLARALEPETAAPGIDVIVQGDEGDRFYVIADGEVDVIADGKLVTTLARGDGFGEIALMYDVPRTATIRTRRQSHLYSLQREMFLVALTGHTSAHKAATSLADRRLAELRSMRGEPTVPLS